MIKNKLNKITMNKKELKAHLIIMIGELKGEVDNESGCFDEIATSALKNVLGCNELVATDSNDILVQLDKSIEDDGLLVDAVFLSSNNKVLFSVTDAEDEMIDSAELADISRESIIKLLDEIYKMCE